MTFNDLPPDTLNALPPRLNDPSIPDLGEIKRRQDQIEERFGAMEYEIEIFRRALAIAVQALGGQFTISDESMEGFDWHENNLELEREEDGVTICSMRLS